MKRMLILGLRCSLLIVLLYAAMPLTASPKCEADTFTGKKGCVYGTGTIGLAGVGNQIITGDGQTGLQRMMQVFGVPVDVDAVLFRLDDRRTLRVRAVNNTRPHVSCSGGTDLRARAGRRDQPLGVSRPDAGLRQGVCDIPATAPARAYPDLVLRSASAGGSRLVA